MNILFFLTPKSEVSFLYNDLTIQQAIETIRAYGYTAIPMIDRKGRYIGTITEGDLLWYLLDHKETESRTINNTLIGEIPRKMKHQAVRTDKNIENLVTLAMEQNFVPVVDDTDRFIGIVTRKAIVSYCAKTVIHMDENK